MKIEINDNDFEEKVIKKSKEIPVVVDFYADWCVPCHILGPILEKLADQYKKKFILVKINIDDNPNTSHIYGITGIPAVKIFKNGKVADEFIGALPESEVEKWLKKNL